MIHIVMDTGTIVIQKGLWWQRSGVGIEIASVMQVKYSGGGEMSLDTSEKLW